MSLKKQDSTSTAQHAIKPLRCSRKLQTNHLYDHIIPRMTYWLSNNFPNHPLVFSVGRAELKVGNQKAGSKTSASKRSTGDFADVVVTRVEGADAAKAASAHVNRTSNRTTRNRLLLNNNNKAENTTKKGSREMTEKDFPPSCCNKRPKSFRSYFIPFEHFGTLWDNFTIHICNRHLKCHLN